MAPRPSSSPPCGNRKTWLLSRGYTMYSNEYTALGGTRDPRAAHACDNMLTVLQLRHPHDRVLSHIKHVFHGYGVRCGPDRDLYFAVGHNTSSWAELTPAPTNNYLIRSLLGEAVFNLPSGAITSAHLDLARALLAQQYDVLLVLEDSELSALVMRHGLGWRQHELHANSGMEDGEAGQPADLEALWELNELDLQLYEYGVVLARLDAVVYDAVVAYRARVTAETKAGAAGGGVEAGSAAVGLGFESGARSERLRASATGEAVGSGPVRAAAAAAAYVQATGQQLLEGWRAWWRGLLQRRLGMASQLEGVHGSAAAAAEQRQRHIQPRKAGRRAEGKKSAGGVVEGVDFRSPHIRTALAGSGRVGHTPQRLKRLAAPAAASESGSLALQDPPEACGWVSQ